MGRDKAFLTFPPGSGETLIARQAALLRSVGIVELIISGRPNVDYSVPTARIVTDTVDNAGPLAGLAAILAASRQPWVLVVAVDLPFLTSAYLERMLLAGAGHTGVVPHGPHGYEPLVALYPRTLLAAADTALANRQLSLQALIQAGVATSELKSLGISAADIPLFANWNNPADVRT